MRLDGKAVFLVSKPLQLMVSLLVIRQLQLDRKPLIIITNSFRGAQEVVPRLMEKFPDKIDAMFFETPQDAFAYIARAQIRHVFIDSDVGLRKFIILMRLKLRPRGMKIFVFEEGLGTYSHDRYSGLKARVFPYIGIATHFGASFFTDNIFVLEPDEYGAKFPKMAKRAIQIEASMTDFLQESHETLKMLFDYTGISQTTPAKKPLCQIYLASWHVDDTFLAHFHNLSGDLFVKAHPHSESDDIPHGIATIDPRAPAELAIADLLESYEKVAVYDHNSSIRRYINSSRVTFQDAHVFD